MVIGEQHKKVLHPLKLWLFPLKIVSIKIRAFCFGKNKIKGFEQGGSRHSMRKKTVRWTVFADVVKEQSDAKVHRRAPKNLLLSSIKRTASLIFQGP